MAMRREIGAYLQDRYGKAAYAWLTQLYESGQFPVLPDLGTEEDNDLARLWMEWLLTISQDRRRSALAGLEIAAGVVADGGVYRTSFGGGARPPSQVHLVLAPGFPPGACSLRIAGVGCYQWPVDRLARATAVMAVVFDSLAKAERVAGRRLTPWGGGIVARGG